MVNEIRRENDIFHGKNIIDRIRDLQLRDNPFKRLSDIAKVNLGFERLQTNLEDIYSEIYKKTIESSRKASDSNFSDAEQKTYKDQTEKYFNGLLKLISFKRSNREILKQNDASYEKKSPILSEWDKIKRANDKVSEIEELQYKNHKIIEEEFVINNEVTAVIRCDFGKEGEEKGKITKIEMQTELMMGKPLTFKQPRENGWVLVKLPDGKGHGFIHRFALKETAKGEGLKGNDASNLYDKFEPVRVTPSPTAEDPEITVYKDKDGEEEWGTIPDGTILPCIKKKQDTKKQDTKKQDTKELIAISLPDNKTGWVKPEEIEPIKKQDNSTKFNDQVKISDSQVGVVIKPIIPSYRNYTEPP